MTSKIARFALAAAITLTIGSVSTRVLGHGSVTPQKVDTTGLKPLGDTWLTVNPYRGDPVAIKIGMSAYGQNCARCHGLEVISGGIAPDLRYLDAGEAGDEWFIGRYQHGSARDGKVFMPPFGPVLGQETGWAIRSYLDTVHQE
ncbi:cytochrome c-550 PedF [Sphingomonas naphthae]|uniref:Cytochrome c-550 PedF n=1 Tax=Sphingomonas naphthae TaxID=1813468 RepID=A0ABY7TJ15_9SPHN|nr:cytochrome c-550 PedF [Sphingomonas naphthae]WCT73207.1 cytochrome c-550 PedF [Sphingomonas naphthae]